MQRWKKASIGVAIAIAALLGLGLWARSGVRNFFYPQAPRMPAAVSAPMPEVLARLEGVLKTKAPHVVEALQPGLSAEDIVRLERQYGVQLPADIKAIYQWHNGSRQATNSLANEFIPTHRFIPLEEALADRTALLKQQANATLLQRAFYRVLTGHRDSWICLLGDGAGDGYWYDPKRKASEGAVFYHFAETGTYTFFPSAKNLMSAIETCYAQGIIFVKPESSPPELDEDYRRAEKVWDGFGTSNQRQRQRRP